MKLLHCLSAPKIGGIERLVIELAISQHKSGIDVSIMLDSRKGEYYEYLIKQNIPLLDSGIKSGFDFNYKTYQKVKLQFKSFGVVHLHSFSPLQLTAAVYSGSKIVYTIHGLSKGVRNENNIKYAIRETLKKYYLNKVDVLVANSEYTLSLAKQHYGLNKTKTLCVLNGIRLPEISIKPRHLNEQFTIGLVSRFTKRKRIDRIIHVFQKYKELGGAGKLILVGDGAEYGAIENTIRELGLMSFVSLVGYAVNVEEYYQQFDLCVFPAQEEPFGLVAVEAYLHGKAILAFKDSGGLKEVIFPLEPNNIVSSVDNMANRILFWEKSRKLLNENAEERKAYAKENFSIERMSNDYLAIYNRLFDV